MKSRISLVLLVLLSSPALVHAQQRRAAFAPNAAAAQSSGAGAFLAQAAGATAGSLLGFGLIYAAGESCDVEDLSCALQKAGIGILTSTAGSVIGDRIAGKLADAEPSTVGAIVGAAAGAAAGVGMWHLFTEELDLVNKTPAAIFIYSATQGILTAAGSRIGRALK